MVLLCALFENGAPLKKAKDREKIRDVKWAGNGRHPGLNLVSTAGACCLGFGFWMYLAYNVAQPLL